MAENVGQKPTKKMKPFHWSKLRSTPAIEASVFKNLHPNNVKIDIKELEELFSQVEVQKKEAAESKPKKQEAVTFINGKTLQAVGIYLKQIGNSKDVKSMMRKNNVDLLNLLVDSVLGLNTKCMTPDRIQMLINAQTESSEIQEIENWVKANSDDPNYMDKLNPVDQYFLKTNRVPQFTQRLKCWQFTLGFEESNTANLTELLLIKKGIALVRESKHFKKILEIVLAIGNFMNFGTRGGQTVGFDISSLSKLVETRANSRADGTLLHFVIQTIRTKYPETMEFTQELADLKYAKNASWDKIDTGIRELKAHLTLARNGANNVTILDGRDKFQEIKNTIAKADEEFKDTQAIHEQVEVEWMELAKMYAKDGKTMKPEEFFVMISTFVEQFESAILDMERRKKEQEAEEEEMRKQKQEEEERKNQAAKLLSGGSSQNTPRTMSKEEQDAAAKAEDLLAVAAGSGAKSSQGLGDREARQARANRLAALRAREKKDNK
eukprot:TRINITY_DN459_c0_g1_i1.p1 TRINITY_DN459_c0_g1~~TRINITY_DN459_c0_g1_i1.p1  ORF type:complete len:547 (-),score=151.56 TRINITY_DN459_c0_g1_i1:60-1541(-)